MWDLETIRRVNAEGLKAIKLPPRLLLSNLIKSTGLAGKVLVASLPPTVRHKIERTELSINEVEAVKKPNE